MVKISCWLCWFVFVVNVFVRFGILVCFIGGYVICVVFLGIVVIVVVLLLLIVCFYVLVVLVVVGFWFRVVGCFLVSC